MAWVRIHDGALTHPRVVGIVDWRAPFCVWVWGLSYCQLHLTDGIIPKEAIPNPTALKTATVLITRGLWIDHGDAFEVHDYLQHNDGRDVVLAKRAGARARSNKHRSTSETRFSAEPVKQPLSAHTPSGVVLQSSLKEEEREKKPLPKSSGQQAGRIFLHRWQLDSLIDTLGGLADTFDLDVWLDELNRSLDGKVMPRDPWKWVQGQLHAEIARRGLPTADATVGHETAEEILRREGVIQ